jgi:hypothetical protein
MYWMAASTVCRSDEEAEGTTALSPENSFAAPSARPSFRIERLLRAVELPDVDEFPLGDFWTQTILEK